MTRLLCLLCLIALPVISAPPSVDWDKLAPEILEHYLALIRIDTSNPPGNETKAAEYVKNVLEKEGIQVKILAQDPARANLVARIKGNGRRKPLLIMGHTDVVGVQRDRWPVDPFAGIRKDGFIYGRGTMDDKDNLTACMMTMLLLKRSGITLDRDVIFLAEAGEEGTGSVGIDYMVKNHWPEIEAEFALAEGGLGISRQGRTSHIEVATTEKVPRGIKIIARGMAGHGSRPRLDNPVVHLANAVSRIAAWEPPMRLNDTTRTYFERLASISPAERAQRYLHVADPQKSAAIQRYFQENEIGHYSILRTSISPTMIKAGFRSNVIPSETEAYLDVRALPDENMDAFVAQLKKVVSDPAVEVVPPPNGRPAGEPSRLDTVMWKALETVHQRLYPGSVTLPTMMTGATDMAQLRAKGVQCYGIGPVAEEGDSTDHGAHSDAERINEQSLYGFVRYVWELVQEVGNK